MQNLGKLNIKSILHFLLCALSFSVNCEIHTAENRSFRFQFCGKYTSFFSFAAFELYSLARFSCYIQRKHERKIKSNKRINAYQTYHVLQWNWNVVVWLKINRKNTFSMFDKWFFMFSLLFFVNYCKAYFIRRISGQMRFDFFLVLIQYFIHHASFLTTSSKKKSYYI